MNYNIPDRVLRDLCSFAKENNIAKIILFGSRARGTNTERSDIDIAVSGGNFDNFYWQVMEKTHSLLSFDIIELNKETSK
ncbi:MAG: nucleotidyltransferase domain-containing protein, partial [Candidatus Riflebacteria bacterium]|nr:nucleotidyltransferase domain-containing protein [Candidatus Riflebacteria bacterium]